MFWEMVRAVDTGIAIVIFCGCLAYCAVWLIPFILEWYFKKNK